MNRFHVVNWWEAHHRVAKADLRQWVHSSESKFGLYMRAFVATFFETSMVLGAGMVDVLRIGEGVKRGGWGYARDGLRLLSVAGPFVRLGRLGMARLVADPGGPLCASVAAAQALSRTGTAVFVRAEAIAAALNAEVKSMSQLIPVLRRFGARCLPATVSSFDALKALVSQHTRSVVLIGIQWIQNGKWVGHAIYAYRNLAGRMVFADRTGKIVSSLAELENYYQGIGTATLANEAVILKNAILVEGATLMSQLAFEVNVILTNEEYGKRATIIPVTE